MWHPLFHMRHDSLICDSDPCVTWILIHDSFIMIGVRDTTQLYVTWLISCETWLIDMRVWHNSSMTRWYVTVTSDTPQSYVTSRISYETWLIDMWQWHNSSTISDCHTSHNSSTNSSICDKKQRAQHFPKKNTQSRTYRYQSTASVCLLRIRPQKKKQV